MNLISVKMYIHVMIKCAVLLFVDRYEKIDISKNVDGCTVPGRYRLGVCSVEKGLEDSARLLNISNNSLTMLAFQTLSWCTAL